VAIAAVVAVVAGAGGTALALTTSAPSHAVSMSRGDLTRVALKVTAGTPFLDVSMGRLGGTLLRVSTPDSAPARPVLSGSRLVVLSLAGASVPPGHVRDSRYASGWCSTRPSRGRLTLRAALSAPWPTCAAAR
jgi:hypothetical protein